MGQAPPVRGRPSGRSRRGGTENGTPTPVESASASHTGGFVVASPAPRRDAKAAPDGMMREARRGLREKERARELGGKGPAPPVRIAYAKRGLVRIGRKDGKSALLRPERGERKGRD